jgi:cytosine/adenosine deaminase-related metal-dependent hydrolase
MSQRISFSGAGIVVGDQFELFDGLSLNVIDGRIFSIGDPISDAEKVNFDSGLLIPMFVDAHCHLGDTGAKELGIGIPMEQVVSPPNGLKHQFLSKLTRDKHIEQLRHGITEMLSNGIIACGDFREQGLDGVFRLKEALKGLPLKVRILGRMSEKSAIKELLVEAESLFEHADGLGIRDVGSYPSTFLQDLRKEHKDKIFAVHVAENSKTEKNSVVDFGCGQALRALDWGADILVHLTHTSANELEKIKSANVSTISCPRSNSILGDGLPDLKNWMNAGMEFGLGTDNLMVSSPDMFREMDFTSRLIRGMNQDSDAADAIQVLKSATLFGAKALQIDDEIGSLSVGKSASFIVLDTNSLNLKYSKDWISAIVHRADVHDIKSIYIEGERFV